MPGSPGYPCLTSNSRLGERRESDITVQQCQDRRESTYLPWGQDSLDVPWDRHFQEVPAN